eukprot:Rmarinus@m.27432
MKNPKSPKAPLGIWQLTSEFNDVITEEDDASVPSAYKQTMLEIETVIARVTGGKRLDMAHGKLLRQCLHAVDSHYQQSVHELAVKNSEILDHNDSLRIREKSLEGELRVAKYALEKARQHNERISMNSTRLAARVRMQRILSRTLSGWRSAVSHEKSNRLRNSIRKYEALEESTRAAVTESQQTKNVTQWLTTQLDHATEFRCVISSFMCWRNVALSKKLRVFAAQLSESVHIASLLREELRQTRLDSAFRERSWQDLLSELRKRVCGNETHLSDIQRRFYLLQNENHELVNSIAELRREVYYWEGLARSLKELAGLTGEWCPYSDDVRVRTAGGFTSLTNYIRRRERDDVRRGLVAVELTLDGTSSKPKPRRKKSRRHRQPMIAGGESDERMNDLEGEADSVVDHAESGDEPGGSATEDVSDGSTGESDEWGSDEGNAHPSHALADRTNFSKADIDRASKLLAPESWRPKADKLTLDNYEPPGGSRKEQKCPPLSLDAIHYDDVDGGAGATSLRIPSSGERWLSPSQAERELKTQIRGKPGGLGSPGRGRNLQDKTTSARTSTSTNTARVNTGRTGGVGSPMSGRTSGRAGAKRTGFRPSVGIHPEDSTDSPRSAREPGSGGSVGSGLSGSEDRESPFGNPRPAFSDVFGDNEKKIREGNLIFPPPYSVVHPAEVKVDRSYLRPTSR